MQPPPKTQGKKNHILVEIPKRNQSLTGKLLLLSSAGYGTDGRLEYPTSTSILINEGEN